jgi:hypothetical protein
MSPGRAPVSAAISSQPPLGEDPAAERRGDGLVRLTGSSIGTLLDVTEACPPAASDARWTLIAAVVCQGAMVLAATILSVVRPGGRVRPRPAPSGA